MEDIRIEDSINGLFNEFIGFNRNFDSYTGKYTEVDEYEFDPETNSTKVDISNYDQTKLRPLTTITIIQALVDLLNSESRFTKAYHKDLSIFFARVLDKKYKAM